MVWGTLATLAAPTVGKWIKNALSGGDRGVVTRGGSGGTSEWDRRVGRMGREGQRLSTAGTERMMSFDPMAAATQASEAQYAMAMPKIKEQLADLRGSQVSAGRLRTGYGQGDQDEMLTANLENLNQSMIARAMQAAQMQQANNQALASHGQGMTNTYLEASMGREMSERDRRAQEAASKRGMWGNLLGAGIDAAGRFAAAKWA